MLSLLFSALVTSGLAARVELNWKIQKTNRPMQDISASVGDTIVFTWRGFHNVFILPECDGADKQKWNSFQCPQPNENWGVELSESSPVEYTIPAKYKAGDYICFVCEVRGHCNAGQHTTLRVVGGGDPQPEPEPVTEIGINWQIPNNGKDQDMQLVEASPGTTLTFTWRGFHNVWLMNECGGKWDEFDCPSNDAEWKDRGENLGDNSPVSYTIPEDFKGTSICFACEVGPHCRLGQHTTVVIKGDKMCCKAMTAQCQACAKDMSVEEVCKEAAANKEELKGCEDMGGDVCCKAMTAQCQACAKKMTVEEVCKEAAANKEELKGCEDMGGDMCCKAMTAKCQACAKKMTVEEVCKEAADNGEELVGCEDAGGDDTPFETLDNLVAFCKLAKADDCKLCMGKFKKGKCAVKAKKLKKIKCKKVKDMAFCKRLGCTVSKKKQTCTKKPKLA